MVHGARRLVRTRARHRAPRGPATLGIDVESLHLWTSSLLYRVYFYSLLYLSLLLQPRGRPIDSNTLCRGPHDATAQPPESPPCRQTPRAEEHTSLHCWHQKHWTLASSCMSIHVRHSQRRSTVTSCLYTKRRRATPTQVAVRHWRPPRSTRVSHCRSSGRHTVHNSRMWKPAMLPSPRARGAGCHIVLISRTYARLQNLGSHSRHVGAGWSSVTRHTTRARSYPVTSCVSSWSEAIDLKTETTTSR